MLKLLHHWRQICSAVRRDARNVLDAEAGSEEARLGYRQLAEGAGDELDAG